MPGYEVRTIYLLQQVRVIIIFEDLSINGELESRGCLTFLIIRPLDQHGHNMMFRCGGLSILLIKLRHSSEFGITEINHLDCPTSPFRNGNTSSKYILRLGKLAVYFKFAENSDQISGSKPGMVLCVAPTWVRYWKKLSRSSSSLMPSSSVVITLLACSASSILLACASLVFSSPNLVNSCRSSWCSSKSLCRKINRVRSHDSSDGGCKFTGNWCLYGNDYLLRTTTAPGRRRKLFATLAVPMFYSMSYAKHDRIMLLAIVFLFSRGRVFHCYKVHDQWSMIKIHSFLADLTGRGAAKQSIADNFKVDHFLWKSILKGEIVTKKSLATSVIQPNVGLISSAWNRFLKSFMYYDMKPLKKNCYLISLQKKKIKHYRLLRFFKAQATSQERGVTCAELSKRDMIRYSAYLY
ncbi:hypothetical protein AGLY_001550 [Aphis glycines]|uniref:Uncharacterized protein n=1 Tax=Aphis glycines TaxID=307491 RepID=A0A6G0U5H3_APHGL|nr:hypothetical protein AGLY_001550 [Aphis glycines]